MTNNNKSPPDRYALVGHPVEHSRSPLIHTVFARQTGQRLTYELIDAEPAAFETAVRGFGAAGGKGLNVTVPHKEAAFALVRRDQRRRDARPGAVNTISIVDGTLRGDNTDGIGFIRDVTVNQRQALAGAQHHRARRRRRGARHHRPAARASSRPSSRSRTAPRSAPTSSSRSSRGTALVRAATFAELAELPPFDVLDQCDVGGPERRSAAVPASLVGPHSFCYDLVYGSSDTPFVAWAKSHGAARAVQGWGMLVEQAAESFAIWRGVRPDTKPLLKQIPR